MSGAERVVDVDIAERGKLRGEPVVVLRLARLEADVLEHDDVARFERRDRSLRALAHDVGGETDLRAGQLGETIGDRSQRERGIRPALGAAQVRNEDDLRAARAQRLDRRQRRANPRVVGDQAIA